MNITFEQTAEDFIDYNYFYLWGRPEKKWARIRLSALPILIFFVIVYSSEKEIGDYGLQEILLLLTGLLIAAFTTPLVKWRSKKLVRKMVNQNPELTGNKSITFEEDIIKIHTSGKELRWSEIKNLRETDKHIFLFVTDNKAVLIPKRAFSTPAELSNAIEFLNNKIQKKGQFASV